MKAMESTLSDFVDAYDWSRENRPATPYVSRARLKASLRGLAAESSRREPLAGTQLIRRRFAYLSGTFAAVLGVLLVWQSAQPSLALSPNPRLTPGSTLPVSQSDVCAREPEPRKQIVLASVGLKVFEEYGISNPQPRRYEMDYLIDPDLGGAEDARNLWPQPYSAVWNAHIKDALEEHLRKLVCTGDITLAKAQQDISADWISAYKKYFHTDRPLAAHLTFEKDQPWE
jgi:hypothetical protein